MCSLYYLLPFIVFKTLSIFGENINTMLIFGLNVIVAVYYFCQTVIIQGFFVIMWSCLESYQFWSWYIQAYCYFGLGLGLDFSGLVNIIASCETEHLSHCFEVFCGQDIDILNGEQFVDWINIDILLVELLFVSYAFEYNSVFMVAN